MRMRLALAAAMLAGMAVASGCGSGSSNGSGSNGGGSSGPNLPTSIGPTEGALKLIAWQGYTEPNVVKPFEESALRATVETALERARLDRNLR